MALKIPDTLWSRLAVLLLLIALAGLSSGLLVRELIVRDFRSFISGRFEDRSYWVVARLEGKYAEKMRWDPADLADDVVWAYMMGLAIRVSDTKKRPLIDIRQTVERMSPAMKKRVFSYARGGINARFGTGAIYPLFHHGEEIGQLEVVCTNPDKDLIFIARSNRLLILSLLTVGTLTLLLSITLSRRITRPVERLTAATHALRNGDMTVRVSQEGTHEFRTMAGTFNRMADALAAQETLRKRLLTNAAHELRTPLTVMRLQVEQMADGMVPADTGRLTHLISEMDRFRGILSALDDLSRAEASAMNIQKQTLQLCRFLEPIVERSACSSQEIYFTFDVPEELTVTADPDRLSQIMINLIDNAIKAVQEGGRIAIRAYRGGNGTIVIVEDSGCGIDEKDLHFIFERFYRGFRHGMGVGLSIVKELVEGHGGTISVQSTVGKGTNFTIFLPDAIS